MNQPNLYLSSAWLKTSPGPSAYILPTEPGHMTSPDWSRVWEMTIESSVSINRRRQRNEAILRLSLTGVECRRITRMPCRLEIISPWSFKYLDKRIPTFRSFFFFPKLKVKTLIWIVWIKKKIEIFAFEISKWDFSGAPVVRTPRYHFRGQNNKIFNVHQLFKTEKLL